MRSWLLGLLALATPFLADEPEVPEDVVHFAKGRPQEGVLVRNDSSGVWLAQKSKVRHYDVSEVVKVEGPRAAYPEYIERMRAEFNEQPDADRCVELAKWCEENGLTRDAQLYYWRALLDNPTHDAAHEGLGHRKSRGLYRIPVKGHGKLSVQEIREVRASDFDDCWELTTMHFKVEAAGDLPDVLAACADLEMVYSAFFKEFQENRRLLGSARTAARADLPHARRYAAGIGHRRGLLPRFHPHRLHLLPRRRRSGAGARRDPRHPLRRGPRVRPQRPGHPGLARRRHRRVHGASSDRQPGRPQAGARADPPALASRPSWITIGRTASSGSSTIRRAITTPRPTRS